MRWLLAGGIKELMDNINDWIWPLRKQSSPGFYSAKVSALYIARDYNLPHEFANTETSRAHTINWQSSRNLIWLTLPFINICSFQSGQPPMINGLSLLSVQNSREWFESLIGFSKLLCNDSVLNCSAQSTNKNNAFILLLKDY